jgi:DNA modification methylase
LRDYKVEGQRGNEATPDEYVKGMVDIFREVKRTLRDEGTLWLNLGDTYAANRTYQAPSTKGGAKHSPAQASQSANKVPEGLKAKDLIGIPWRVAFALQQDGWYLRAACPWIKRNSMPESAKDRPTTVIEHMFMLTKTNSPYYDHQAVKVECSPDMRRRAAAGHTRGAAGKLDASRNDQDSLRGEHAKKIDVSKGRARRTSDWFFESWQGLLQDGDEEPMAFIVNTKPYKGAHFACFPPDLVRPCILASTSEKGCCPDCGAPYERVTEREPSDWQTERKAAGEPVRHGLSGAAASGAGGFKDEVSHTTGWKPTCDCAHKDPIPQTILDPFGGSGTTAQVAQEHGRNAILIELNSDYIELAKKRCGVS